MQNFFAAALLTIAGAHTARTMQVTNMTPVALIDQATQRMDKAIAHVRKTGRLADVKGEFALAESEFHSAWQALSSGADHNPKATFALLRSADCMRIVQRWTEARETYRKAIAQARAAGEVEYEAKGWLGIAKLEQIGLRDNGAAALAVEQALRLVRSAGNLEALEASLLLQQAISRWLPKI